MAARRISTYYAWRSLLLATLYLAAADPGFSAGAENAGKLAGPQVFGLRSHSPETGRFEDERGWLWGDLLIRELMRQAVLMAARDELGLATRDEALREPMTAQADVKVVDIVTQARHGRSVWLRLTHEGNQLWQYEQPCIVGPVNQYIDITEKMERLSRTELARVIRQLGLRAPPLPNSNQGRVRDEILEKVAEINLLSQFDALRLCHDQIRNEGESPERLGALVRAYAHLGQLTQPFLSSMHRSFRARSLLYAQRLISTSPESPWGWRHRAYALSLAGLQRWSIEDLKRADELMTKSSNGQALPAWVQLLKAHNRYEFAALLNSAKAKDELSQLAGLLLFASVETSKTTPFIVEVGMLVSNENPLDLRVWDGMHREAGVGYLHVLTEEAPNRFTATLTKKLPELSCLNDAARPIVERASDSLGTIPGRSRLALAFVQHASKTTDRIEPSLAVLGQLIDEQNVLQICRRAQFMRDAWGVDSKDFLRENYRAYKAHPYAGLVSCLGLQRGSQSKNFQKLLNDQHIGDTNLVSMDRLVSRVPNDVRFANMSQDDAWSQLYHHRSALEFEYYLDTASRGTAEGRVQYAKWMYDVSPHSAFRHYVLIREDLEASQSSLEKWQREYGQHPLIALAFAEQFESQRDWKLAEQHYRRHVELVPTVAGLTSLARVQHRQHNEDWLGTLKAALELRDYGLSHARANTIIAATLMERSNYAEALPYAEEAAASYAAWALHCLALCYEGLQQFDKAEMVMRISSQRYDDAHWYYWCIRTGRGDVAAAWNLCQSAYRDKYGADSPVLHTTRVQHHIFMGQIPEAFTLAKNNEAPLYEGVNALVLALLADEVGHKEKAPALVDVARSAVEEVAAQDAAPFSTMAQLLIQVMTSKDTSEEEIERLLAQNQQAGRAAVLTYLGWHLANRGQKELAKKYLGQIAGSDRWTSYDVLYAQVKLRELGIGIEDVPRRYRDAFNADE